MQHAMTTSREQLAALRQHVESGASLDTPEARAAVVRLLDFAEAQLSNQAEFGRFIAHGSIKAAVAAKVVTPEIGRKLQRFIAELRINADSVRRDELADASPDESGRAH